MAYNLPPPWSPKYAYPANTRVEALQRGTFTTRQQPRGSYDDPAVGAAGYAIPGYVLDTPYGQGALVTKWMPRGTVVGNVPHWVQQPNFAILAQTKASGDGDAYEIGPPIDSVHDDPFATYGVRVANEVMSGLNRLPAAHRKSAMKTLFDRIDPKLYTRVTATATKAARAGIPPKRALHHAIAVEARSGFLRELHSIGVSGHVSPGSQTGLGCWGCAAIGLGGLGATMTLDKSAIAAKATSSRDKRNGGSSIVLGPQAPVIASTDRFGNPIAGSIAPTAMQTVAVGPFSFAIGGNTIDHRNVFTSPSQLTADQQAWLASQIKGHLEHDAGQDPGAQPPGGYGILPVWFPGVGSSGQTIDSDYKSPDGIHFAVNPIVGNIPDPTNPTGEPYGIFLFVCGTNCNREPTPNTGNGPYLMLVSAPMSKAGQTAWSQFVGKVGSVIGSIASAIGGIACDVLGHPAASTAAAAATGGAAGTGVKLAGAICQANAPAPLVGPAVSTGFSFETLAIVGGGAALLYLLTRRRKSAAATRTSHRSKR